MTGSTWKSLRRELACHRCGGSVDGKGVPYEYRLEVYEETEAAMEAVLRLCRPCADDFPTGEDRDAYLERLLVA